MAMAISLETAKRKLRKNVKKRRANNGHKPEKQAHPSLPTERKGKEGMQRPDDPLLGRDYLKFKP